MIIELPKIPPSFTCCNETGRWFITGFLSIVIVGASWHDNKKCNYERQISLYFSAGDAFLSFLRAFPMIIKL
jgi:hypothetical protein